MSQQTLINISPGDTADADVIMGNFDYLNVKLATNIQNMTALENNVNNLVNTTVQNVERTLSIYQDIVQPKSSFDDSATTVTSGDCYIKSNTIVAFTPTGNVTFHLPTITDNTKFYQILVQVKLDNASYISASNNRLGTNHFFNSITPEFEVGLYDIIYSYDSNEEVWFCTAISKG